MQYSNLVMSDLRKHPSIIENKRRSVFPEALQVQIRELGKSAHQKNGLSAKLSEFRKQLGYQRVHSYRAITSEIRELASMRYHDYSSQKKLWGRSRLFETRSLQRQLQSEPNLSFLLMFHGNGFIREHALNAIDEPLQSPLEIIALADLANNWVEEVRKAAFFAILRTYPQTNARHFAKAFGYFHLTHKHWQRWSPSSMSHIKEFFYRPQVIHELMSDIIADRVVAPVATFRYSLQYEDSEKYLMNVFKGAINPSVKSIALKCMLYGEASWFDTYDWEWVDKSMGVRRRVAKFARRELSRKFPNSELIAEAARHKSTSVRLVAVQALIDRGPSFQIDRLEIAEEMQKDPSSSIRSRANFILKNSAG